MLFSCEPFFTFLHFSSTVGHIHDATEGVGGLGGDADGMPVGMGAGAEPLGMSKGKESSMDSHSMQGLSEGGEWNLFDAVQKEGRRYCCS